MGKRKSKFGQDLVDIYGVPEAICSIFSPFLNLFSIVSIACSRIPKGEHYACTNNITLS